MKMGYTRAIIRFLIPISGIGVMAALSEEPRLFLSILLFPLALALPVIVWSTIKIGRQMGIEQSIDKKYIIFYGCSLIFLATGACFYFMLESGLSHSTVTSEVFRKKCLFVFMAVIAYPLVDLILRQYLISVGTAVRKIRRIMVLTGVTFLATAVLLLVQIVGSPLNAALRFDYRNIAKTLIVWGADVHNSDRYRATPLWYAIHKGDLEMTTFLFDNGAKLDASIEGFGLSRAAQSHNDAMLRLLLSKGADSNSTYMGATSLVWACLIKDKAMAKILLENGADINFKGHYPNVPYDGKSPLDLAYENNDSQMLELLLSSGKNNR
jgi:hypothetical protein